MPRIARQKGDFQTYHVIQRGNERRKIFTKDDDRTKFLDILAKAKKKYNFYLEAYCLMDNHIHLLIDDNGNDISQIVKSINISYAYYFNHVYQRVGHLFQDRFKSELVAKDDYLIAVSAYIHNNPVKAGKVKMPGMYEWSSLHYYMGKAEERPELVDTERILGLFSEHKKKAANEYYSFIVKYEPQIEVLDIDEDKLIYLKAKGVYIDTFNEAYEVVKKELASNGKEMNDLMDDRDLRREMIVKLRKDSSLNLREIGQLCGGISQSLVCKILKNS